MTDKMNVGLLMLPCHNCIKADLGPDGRPMMCVRVASVILRSLQECAVDTSADMRLDAQIAASQLGKYSVVDQRAMAACIPVPLPPPAENMGILEIIQC